MMKIKMRMDYNQRCSWDTTVVGVKKKSFNKKNLQLNTSPITVHVGNMGAVFMFNNVRTLSRTIHVDIPKKLYGG